MRKIPRLMAAALTLALLLSLAGCGSSDGKTHLTFQIWDVAQRDGMQAMCDAYTAQVDPNVVIEVQVTNWSEYWTKLEAAAESNTMPDIYWMHTDQILYYADFGILADLTDLYADEDASYYQNHFSDISIGNASGTDGRIYGIPKDKDNVLLVYNKEMFDAAGVAYPTADWTWDDLTDASQKIFDATGKYGYMAYNDEQLGYWNFVYQKGGYILDPETNIHAGYTQPATAEAVKFYLNLQKNDWCPDQNYFAETSPGTAFFSGMGCMFLEGSWNLLNEMKNYPDMVGKWDIAMLPRCPDPVSGDGRGSISNGLCYSAARRASASRASPARLFPPTWAWRKPGPSLSETLTTCWTWSSATVSSTTPSSTSTTPAAGSGNPTWPTRWSRSTTAPTSTAPWRGCRRSPTITSRLTERERREFF